MTATPIPNLVIVGAGGTTTFLPAIITIAAGQTVTWQWPAGIGPHSVTYGTCDVNFCTPLPPPPPILNFNSGTQIGPFQFQVTFPQNGTFTYFCLVHGVMMQGTVNVF